MQADKIYRMESFKNQSFKNRVADTEKYCEKIRIGLTKRLISQCKTAHYNRLGQQGQPSFLQLKRPQSLRTHAAKLQQKLRLLLKHVPIS